MLRLAVTILVGLFSTAASSQTVLIENVRMFNGVDHELTPGFIDLHTHLAGRCCATRKTRSP